MKIQSLKLLVLSFSFAFFALRFTLPCFAQDVKLPNVSGAFYPDNPQELSEMIESLLTKASPQPPKGNIFALIVPHAGYGYSGQTAAFGFKLIKEGSYKTVIVMGSSHYYGFTGVSIYPRGVFRTPLGNLEIDSELADGLLDKDKEIRFLPKAFEKEHSVEVELPFLQKTLSGFKIVPVLFGDSTLETCKKTANLLKEAIGERRDVLVIVSTDMYHGYDFKETELTDNLTLSYIKDMDAEGLYYSLREGKAQLCGGFGVVTAMILSKALGYDSIKLLNYTNSSLVTGNKKKGAWTVGYASCVIARKEASQQEYRENAMLNKEQRKKLLGIARNSIEAYLRTGKKLELSEQDPVLLKEMGAFVTLNERGELRGCIGNLAGDKPLYLMARDMAVEAAVGDPRFTPLEADELAAIEIEISVLSPLERIDSVEKIRMGEHGVLVRKGFNSGVFLPQVATETGWSKEEFLSNLCLHKAGLSPGAWKDKSTEIYIFTAEVFSEKDSR